jgi:GT2 family glycosyltransferase
MRKGFNPLSDARSNGIREARALLAIARANELAARAKATELEARVDELESEVQLRCSEMLELGAVFGVSAHGNRLRRRMSVEAKEVRRLFAGIYANKGDTPSSVTVVIPVYGKVDFTLRCLRSIAETWSYSINPSIVVVDDASPDDSLQQLIGIPGVDVLRNGVNLGYLRSTNRGSDLAKSRYVCFLNNDTEVKAGWLETLVQTAEHDPKIGAVGSKLVYPDGTLQEAGGIIWSDASGWNYGRGDDPNKSEYNFPRDVDYCSAASLLVRTDLLREIGGFDERFAPAYYEDVDLCFEIARRGYRVVYEPRSTVVHYEGTSSGTDIERGVKRFQAINQPKFAAKWRETLATKLAPSADNVDRAVYGAAHRTVLIIDSYVPLYDREAGSNRLFKIVQILRELNYRVLFFPANGAPVEPYSTDLARLGVEVVYPRPGIRGLERLLESILHRVDLAWICRPELCELYVPIVRGGTSAPIIYDTIDLHFARERRRAELDGGDDEVWQKLRDTELAMARAADHVITVTSEERAQLNELGVEAVSVIPTIHDLEPHRHFDFAVRSGLVFIGGYGHPPNVDAVLWLCNDIMPIVWKELPDVHVTLLGNNPSKPVLALRSDRVSVTGFVADVTPYFEEARLFVAPLRYGAGMKGKVGHALSFGLPTVLTPVAAEGFDLTDGHDCLIAGDSESFAQAVITLYSDPALWQRLSDNGSAAIREFGLEAVGRRLRDLFSALGVGPQ